MGLRSCRPSDAPPRIGTRALGPSPLLLQHGPRASSSSLARSFPDPAQADGVRICLSTRPQASHVPGHVREALGQVTSLPAAQTPAPPGRPRQGMAGAGAAGGGGDGGCWR